MVSTYSGKIQAITFSFYLPNFFKSIWHFEDNLATLPASIRLCWLHLAKPRGQAERQGPWASCLADRVTTEHYTDNLCLSGQQCAVDIDAQ